MLSNHEYDVNANVTRTSTAPLTTGSGDVS